MATEKIEQAKAEIKRLNEELRREIAERERLLTELAESRHLSERIVKTSPDALYIYDLANGSTTYVNARSEQVIGYAADEVLELGNRFAVTLWHPDDALKLPEHRRRLKELADGEITEFEYRVLQHDGTYRWLRSLASAFARTDGQVGQVIIVTQNVTEYKRAEEALRESEERFRSYFELGLVGMAITSPTKGILEANDEICKILGYERDELLRMTWTELTHPDDVAADIVQFNQIMAGEIDGYSMDKRWIRKDGEVIDATISVKCLRSADGSVDYFIALLEEITDRKRAEEALRRARDELEQRVIERTSQLSATNDDLLKEVAERKRAEEELTRLKDELASDLEAMKGLHELSRRLLVATELQPLLEGVLDATMALLNADFGNIQLYDPTSGALKIVAQRGFKQDFLDYFDSLHEGTASCGAALKLGERVIVEDVETDPVFAPHLEIVASAGYRAVQSTPLFSRSGEPLGMLSTHFREPHRPSDRELRVTDLYARQASEMIERKRAEEQLAYHARLLENVHDAVIATDERLSITAWNKAAQGMYGWTADEVMGRNIWEAVPVEMSEEQRAEAFKALADTGRFSVEAITYCKDGAPVYVEGITIALRGEQGEITGYVNIRRDISKRKRAEEALKESHGRIENVLESITEDFYTVDREWRFTYINERALHSAQRGLREKLRREDLLGKSVWECFPELVGTVFYQKYHEAMREQKAVELEAYSPLRGRWAEVHAYPSEDGLSVHILDVTERKQAEEALLEAQAELAHASRVATMGEMTALIAHEINQPLAAIVTNGQTVLRLLARAAPDLAGMREAVEAMIGDGLRAAEVIKQIRALMRKTVAEKVPVNINEIIQEVIALTASEMAKNRGSLEMELEPDLPKIMGNRVQLQQVLLNLILNANEAMSGAEWQPRELLIGSEQSKPVEVLVSVRDSGCGFDPQTAERIFDPFFTTKPNEGGLGLGLSISRTIIEAHGGRLWATPNEGKGVTFRFTLPASV